MQSRPEKSEALTAATGRASMNHPSESNHQENSVNNSTLVPVFSGTLGNCTVQLCDARTLHTFMQVRRDFTTWIKARIHKFGFIAGEDYLLTKSGEQLPSGTKYVHDYHLTLDMAKELAMVENNEQGRAARRYFIECERRALSATIAATGPTINYARISPAEAQDLKQIVKAIVDAGVQTHGETWARLQRKFKVNSYLQLPASQYDAARTYLIAKLPADQASHDVHDAVTLELSDTQRMELAFSTAAEASAHVQRTVFKAMMTGKNADWRQARYLLSLGYDRDGQATLPFAQALGDGQIVASLPELAKHITNADIMASDTQLTTLASACMQRLNERAAVRERCAATAVAMVPATAPAAHPATAVQSTTTAAPIPPHIGLDGKPLPPGTFRAVFV